MINFPASPSVGQQFTAAGTTWIWDGTGWNIVPQMGPMSISDTPPPNPAIGQVWWRSTNGQMYVWYSDGSSSQWVQAAGTANLSMPFTKEFISTEQTITAGGTLSLSHGLGIAPKLIMPVLINKITELGYSVGDVIPADYQAKSSSVADGFGTSFELSGATDIVIRYGSQAGTFLATRKSDGTASNITNANWRLIMRAWA